MLAGYHNACANSVMFVQYLCTTLLLDFSKNNVLTMSFLGLAGQFGLFNVRISISRIGELNTELIILLTVFAELPKDRSIPY